MSAMILGPAAKYLVLKSQPGGGFNVESFPSAPEVAMQMFRNMLDWQDVEGSKARIRECAEAVCSQIDQMIVEERR